MVVLTGKTLESELRLSNTNKFSMFLAIQKCLIQRHVQRHSQKNHEDEGFLEEKILHFVLECIEGKIPVH